MSIYQFDPAEWLVSTTRSLEDYAKSKLDANIFDVQMSFPDPDVLVQPNPASKVLVHFERDDVDSPAWAFGIQGVDEWSDPSHATGTFRVLESQRHVVNFDIGVWATLDAGGETIRMRAVQALHDMFGPNGARQDFNILSGGIVVRSFSGGSDATDRINDVPVWRTIDMTLVLEVFSRSDPVPDVVPESFDQTSTLDIIP